MTPTEQRYQGAPGRAYHEGKRSLPPSAIPWVCRLRARKLARFVQPEDRIVEYGVGSGWNLAALPCRQKLGFDVADFLEPSLRAQGIEFVACPQSLPDGAADVALCYHTLEHVLEPASVLREICRWLNPSGRLILVVPWERERRCGTFQRGELNHHLYTWSVQNLGNLVEECGFKVASARWGTYGYDRWAATWACRLRLGETGYRILRTSAVILRPLREVHLLARKLRSGNDVAVSGLGQDLAPNARTG